MSKKNVIIYKKMEKDLVARIEVRGKNKILYALYAYFSDNEVRIMYKNVKECSWSAENMEDAYNTTIKNSEVFKYVVGVTSRKGNEISVTSYLGKNYNYNSNIEDENYYNILKRFKRFEAPSELSELNDLNKYLENLVAILNLKEDMDFKKAAKILKNIVNSEKKSPINVINEIREELRKSGEGMLDAAVRNYIILNFQNKSKGE